MNDRTDKRPRRRRRLRLASLLAACGITAAVVPALPATATLTTTFSGTVDANGVLGPSFKVNKFAVQSIGTIHAALTWSGTASMGMMLKDPTGAVAAATKFTTVQPITLDFDAASLGNWNLGVKSKSGAATGTSVSSRSPGLRATR